MIRQDLRHAVRAVAARPLFSLLAALSLALGIGANTAIFSLWNSVARAPLTGVAEPDSLVMLTNPTATGMWRGTWGTGADGPRLWVTYAEFEQLRDHAASFASLMASQSPLQTWQGRVDGGAAEPLFGRLVSGAFFDVLGARPTAGRLFSREHDAAPRAEAVVSYAFWQRRLGGRADAIGRTVIVRETPLTIVGITPAGFAGESAGQQPDVWLPLRLQPIVIPGADWLREQPPDKVMWLQAFGRLKPGVTMAQAEAEVNALLRRQLASFYGAATLERQPDLLDQRLRVQSGARGVSSALGEFASSVSTLFVAVAILLVIGCANIANLLLARGASRRGELAIRLSLGATRGQLLRHVFVESAVLAVAGGVMAIVVASGLHAGLVRLLQASDPRLAITFVPNLPVLLFTSMATLAAAVASGILPAWQLSRTEAGGHLADARRGTAGSARELRSGRWVVGVQLALSLPLLVGAGLLVQTIVNLQRPNLGIEAEGLLLSRLDLGRLTQDTARRDRALRAVVERLQATARVERVSFSQLGILNEGISTSGILVEGSLVSQDTPRDGALDRVGPGYFTTLGVPLRAGRDIEARDDADAPKVAVVNAAFAARHFGTGAVLGREITALEPGDVRTRYTIVGVAADAHTHGLRSAVVPRFFVPAEQRQSAASNRTLLIRTRLSVAALHARVLDIVASVDREMSIIETLSVHARVASVTAEDRALAQLATVFGVVALLLAGLGLYGVLEFGVVRRTPEIAVRIALGAESRRVVRLILSENLWLVTVAIGAGSVLAMLGTRLLSSRLYGVAGGDPHTLVAAAGVLLLVATVAVYFPARRASRVEPMVALRRV